MRILITGKEGKLGWEQTWGLQTFGDIIPVSRTSMDLEQLDSICAMIRDTCPNFIANAAAYTLDDQTEAGLLWAHAINSIRQGIIAEEAKRIDVVLIHYSTDYVFDGAKQAPYVEKDAPSLCNVYGQSKLPDGQAVAAVGGVPLILRASWVYGASGRNFFKINLRLATGQQELRVVADQFGVPTCLRFITLVTAHIHLNGEPLPSADGLYHLVASGWTSQFGLLNRCSSGCQTRSRGSFLPNTVLFPLRQLNIEFWHGVHLSLSYVMANCSRTLEFSCLTGRPV